MKSQVMAVRDRAMDAFMRPMFVPAVGAGVRAFSDEVNRKAADNSMNVHPEDFDLYHLGEFDEQTGAFELFSAPKMVAVGKNVYVGSV